MSFNFDNLVKQYYDTAQGDDYPRLRGWEFLWDYVCEHDTWIDLVNEESSEKTALHLGFYLANWGMFRGSSGLLNTNLDFFKDLADYLFKEIPFEFWELNFTDFHPDDTQKHKLASELFENAIHKMERFKSERVTWTETLKSKILLGLWGQCPALDTFYSGGLSLLLDENPSLSISPKGKINSNSLTCLNVVSTNQNWNLGGYSTHYGNNEYPAGKVIDMAFFQNGWNNA
ncbi:MAG: hypothetical protein HRU20_14955 [Pseudomonadales bacterium]|nr:hypothetical protein [Pseudomonadales bacterium]